MPWRTTCAMDERMRFIVEHQRGEEGMAELCRRAGISRKTGYKWLARHREAGPSGLAVRSSAPQRHPNAVPPAVVERVLAARAAHPTWGPKKLVAWLGEGEPEHGGGGAAAGRAGRAAAAACARDADGRPADAVHGAEQRLVRRLRGAVSARGCELVLSVH